MVVARYTHGQLVILDRLREMVRLGAGLEEDGRLNKEVTARTLLKDNDRIKICDNLIAFVEESARPPLLLRQPRCR